MSSVNDKTILAILGKERMDACMAAANEFMKNNVKGGFHNLPDIIKEAINMLLLHVGPEDLAKWMADKIEQLGWHADREIILDELELLDEYLG